MPPSKTRRGSAGRHGVVAASHPLAAEAGAEVLRAGGNAVDAAAATQFALNVVEPAASGIGGGSFSLIRLAAGQIVIVDGREQAPAASTADQFLGPDDRPLAEEERETRGTAVGMPGALLAQCVALERWGSLSLGRVLQPAIALAEGGVAVNGFLARRLQSDIRRLRANPASAAVFLPGGTPLREGEQLLQPDLAHTLRLIAEHGPEGFYRGEIGRALVETVGSRGGRMTLGDLSGYRVELRKPLEGQYAGYKVASMPPPGSGLTLLQMLGLLEPFEPGAVGPHTIARAHRELQAMRLALADRGRYLADPRFTHVPLAALLDARYLAKRRDLIASGSLGPDPEPGTPESLDGPAPAPPGWADDSLERGETTHLVVLDRWGNLVCTTATIESWFGSGMTVPGYGFLLNNELTDFDARPGGANQVRPLARPASSMAPTLLLDEDRPWLALGSPGGPTIAAAILQVLLRVVGDHLSLDEAVHSPRFFAKGHPSFSWEEGLPEETLRGLAALGHEPAARPTTIGSVQAIMLDPETGQPTGVADKRRDPGVVVVVD